MTQRMLSVQLVRGGALQRVLPLCLSSASAESCHFPSGPCWACTSAALDPLRPPPLLALSVTAAASLPGFWITSRLEFSPHSAAGWLATLDGLFISLGLSCCICNMGMRTPMPKQWWSGQKGLSTQHMLSGWLLSPLHPQALVCTLLP